MAQASRGLTGYSGQERERGSLAASIKTDTTDFIFMLKKICPRSRKLYLRLLLTALASLAEMLFLVMVAHSVVSLSLETNCYQNDRPKSAHVRHLNIKANSGA